MSIWFSLPLNLPASDPEKVQVRNRGKETEVMDKTESRGVALGGPSGGVGTTGKWESQVRLGSVAGRAIYIEYYRMITTEPEPGSQRNRYG